VAIERIDPDACTGCGTCVKSCPLDVIRMDAKGNRAIIKYGEDCMCCFACLFDCPAEAIHLSPEKQEQFPVGW